MTKVNASDLKVGDDILFDHFGGKDRRGKVVKITASAIHVEWTAPSSGVTRKLRIATTPKSFGACETYGPGSYTLPPTTYDQFAEKNVRLVRREQSTDEQLTQAEIATGVE